MAIYYTDVALEVHDDASAPKISGRTRPRRVVSHVVASE